MHGMGISAAYGMRKASTASSTSACTMPATGVRPPLFTLAAVRAMAPVAGMPPNSTDATLPTPWATSSMFARWCELIMESATTHESSDSMAAKMAMVMPLGSCSRSRSSVRFGTCSVGRPALIVYRSPTVFTFMLNSGTMAVPTMTATSELGIFASSFKGPGAAAKRGQPNSTAKHTAPTSSACQLKVPIFAASAATLSTVSTVWVPAG